MYPVTSVDIKYRHVTCSMNSTDGASKLMLIAYLSMVLDNF